jgi:hypothetical protein
MPSSANETVPMKHNNHFNEQMSKNNENNENNANKNIQKSQSESNKRFFASLQNFPRKTDCVDSNLTFQLFTQLPESLLASSIATGDFNNGLIFCLFVFCSFIFFFFSFFVFVYICFGSCVVCFVITFFLSHFFFLCLLCVDGYDDIVLGSPGANFYNGAVYIINGRAGMLVCVLFMFYVSPFLFIFYFIFLVYLCFPYLLYFYLYLCVLLFIFGFIFVLMSMLFLFPYMCLFLITRTFEWNYKC